MKMKKVLAMTLALVLVVAASVAGTMAWLMAETDAVTNTFTTGDISITLTETTEDYKIVPGGKDAKDPMITVKGGSEKCYVYAFVENNLVLDGKVVATPNIDAAKWDAIKVEGNKTIYRYAEIVDAASGDVKCPVFTEVSYSGEITKENMDILKGKTIVVDAFAHQSDNTDYVTADNAAIAHFLAKP